MIEQISNALPQAVPVSGAGEISKARNNFLDMMKSMIDQVNDSQTTGDQAIEKSQTGEASHLHEVMLATEEADVSLRMLVQMRNKALSAYEEIMRLQI
jgi:flagellar hook-basal body complex protein FliE